MSAQQEFKGLQRFHKGSREPRWYDPAAACCDGRFSLGFHMTACFSDDLHLKRALHSVIHEHAWHFFAD